MGNRQAGFGTPISPQYQLASYNITDLNLSVYAPHGLEYGLFVTNVFDKAGEVSASILANEYNPASRAQQRIWVRHAGATDRH